MFSAPSLFTNVFFGWVPCLDTGLNKSHFMASITGVWACAFPSKTPVKTVVWPTTFPWGPHLLSVVHGLLEGLPTSQHLISHTSTSYIRVRHTLSFVLSLFKGLRAITKPTLTGQKCIFKIHPIQTVLYCLLFLWQFWRKLSFLFSCNGGWVGTCFKKHFQKVSRFHCAGLVIIIVLCELKQL